MEHADVYAYLALVITSVSVGYWAGRTVRPKLSLTLDTSQTQSFGGDARVGMDADDEECKMVLVVRSDLGMSTGKIAAQCSHATLACYKVLLNTNPVILRQWERSGQTKVALRCSSEDELLKLQAQAQGLDLCARSIQDAGRTQIAAGSRTVLGIAGESCRLRYPTCK